MALTNCMQCKKMFNKTTSPLCDACIKKEEDEYELVRLYLIDNPGSTIDELSENNRVSVKKITRWIREGRFEELGTNLSGLACNRCGDPIKSGRYCDKCSKTLKSVMGSKLDTKPDLAEKAKNPSIIQVTKRK